MINKGKLNSWGKAGSIMGTILNSPTMSPSPKVPKVPGLNPAKTPLTKAPKRQFGAKNPFKKY
jgi:hypothetical protein